MIVPKRKSRPRPGDYTRRARDRSLFGGVGLRPDPPDARLAPRQGRGGTPRLACGRKRLNQPPSFLTTGRSCPGKPAAETNLAYGLGTLWRIPGPSLCSCCVPRLPSRLRATSSRPLVAALCPAHRLRCRAQYYDCQLPVGLPLIVTEGEVRPYSASTTLLAHPPPSSASPSRDSGPRSGRQPAGSPAGLDTRPGGSAVSR